ncbi:FGGY-family carbohydrate kinase [Tabrizicola sp. J26]|uniref:FGGY-family carbohydrate kinase n=1 Tax=Alitabrizicola rongguiensis TaxID=2909234 RepID=UPI001F382B3F|nr:FGGY-family carbohydrate kinase [Tabrizicola rongguiensis]MCF1709931.1 FGGY-family carbohydrate kinase [Tabrizicola rongguiensis]
MTFTLGVDIGTFESKGVIVDDAGRIIAAASRPHEMLVPRPGWAEHRAEEDWWGDFVHIVRELLNNSQVKPEEIAAIATSAIGPCMLPVDHQGRPLTNGVLYGVDTRASVEIADITERLGADAILARGGNALTSQSVGPKILWLRKNRPDVWKKTSKIMTSTTYLTYRLTGEMVIDHYTAANYSPLYDIAQQDWRDDLGWICPRRMLPRLLWSTEIAGLVTAEAAAETGLAEGIPVTCGTIDAAAEAVSVGVRQPGDLMLMYGSTVFVILIADHRLTDPRLWHAPWLFPGQFSAMAGLATSGTLTHWFRDELARDLDQQTAFAVLAGEAATSPPGAKGLIVLPHFSGERTPIHDPLAKGAIFGLNLTHGRGDLYRATLEGIACATRAITDTYAEAGQPVLRVRAVGGGTKNAIWLKATSDLTGLDQTLCEVTSGAAYGDAFLARLAIGGAPAADIDVWNPAARIVDAAHEPAYDRLYPLYRRLYAQTKDIAAALEDEGRCASS